MVEPAHVCVSAMLFGASETRTRHPGSRVCPRLGTGPVPHQEARDAGQSCRAGCSFPAVGAPVGLLKGFPGSSAVKYPRAMQETRVLSLGREDPLEEGMATHSSILAWRIPWTEEPGGLQPMGPKRAGHD